MAIPDLDVRTLLAVLCIILALSSLALTLLYRLHPRLPGPRDWATGMVCICVGVGLVYGRDVIPPFWSIAVANTLVLIGHAFLVSGARHFLGQQAGWPVLASVAVAFSLPVVVFHDTPDALGLRIISVSLGMSLLVFLGARTMVGGTHDWLNARYVITGLLALHGIINLARAAQYALQPEPTMGIMQVSSSMGAFFVWAIIFIFSVTAGLSVMVTERLRDMLQERLAEQNAARRAAEATLQEQRNFLTMVSHEFRTPLGIMAASADLITCNLPADDQESAEELERIHRASRRLANLVEGCLADDVLETVSQSRRSSVLDVGTVLGELASEYSVALDVATKPVKVDADPYLLPIAFSALLDNACKYARTPDGVRVSCSQKGKTVEVTFYDNGPGIDPTEVSRLFEKFYRARRTQHKPGAGLGLHLVQRILALHDGHIRLDQTHGTVFRVTLPALKT